MSSVRAPSEDMVVEDQAVSEESFYELGMHCASGRFGRVDLIAAHKWFNLAAHRGSAAAAERRRELAGTMSAAEIAEAQRLAREWITQH
jgi:uncharacterized protein